MFEVGDRVRIVCRGIFEGDNWKYHGTYCVVVDITPSKNIVVKRYDGTLKEYEIAELEKEG